MSTSAISKRYARALVGLGAEQGMVERYGEELSSLTTVLETETLLRLIVESPTFHLEKKSAIIAEISEKLDFSEGMKNFIGLLVEKDRLKYLSQIEGVYRDFADSLSGVLRARIVSATDLSDEQKTAIGSGLVKQTGKKVELKVDVDETLIGGLQAEIGGRLFDGSLKTQLKRFEDTLKKG